MELNRIERLPPALQTGVHTLYTTIPLYRKRDSNSQNVDSKSTAYAIPPFLHLINISAANLKFVEIVGFEPTQSKDNGFTDRPNSPSLAYFQFVWEAGLEPATSRVQGG